jgi:hypothetical protein
MNKKPQQESISAKCRRAGQNYRTVLHRMANGQTLEQALTPQRKKLISERPDAKPGEPGSVTWSDLPWAQDPYAQQFVRDHPGGAEMELVAKAMGFTRQRVEQIERSAYAKLREAGLSNLVEMFASVQELSDAKDAREISIFGNRKY